jgi:hypothetical protein
MFHGSKQNECLLLNYRQVLLLGEVGLPLEDDLLPDSFLLDHLTKIVAVVVDDALDARIVVHVPEIPTSFVIFQLRFDFI